MTLMTDIIHFSKVEKKINETVLSNKKDEMNQIHLTQFNYSQIPIKSKYCALFVRTMEACFSTKEKNY